MKIYSRWLSLALAALLGFGATSAMAEGAPVLKAKYGELRGALRNNNFHQPIYIDSSQSGDNLRGDVYALLDHSFAEFSTAMKDPDDWCEILILPFNTKYCHAVQGKGGPSLLVRIGRKVDQPISQAYKLDFSLHAVSATTEYFESRLGAQSGPMGTRDYRIVISAVPVDGGRTFMHLSYSYGYGAAGRFAMQAYLSTVGADKVGFSVQGKDGNGQPIYIGGMLGAIERNAMRYYLAIDAHLASLSAPADQRLEKRIIGWFNSTERYSRQLREMDRSTYVAMKRGEHQRQQAMID